MNGRKTDEPHSHYVSLHFYSSEMVCVKLLFLWFKKKKEGYRYICLVTSLYESEYYLSVDASFIDLEIY